MENLFTRLSRLPYETTRVKHIKFNLIPEYLTQLALHPVDSINDLITLVRRLEEASCANKRKSIIYNPNVIRRVDVADGPSTSFNNFQNIPVKYRR